MTAADKHRDAAAYALGVLEPLDALRCADHLTGCPGCAGEHAEFVRLAAALAELVPPPARTGPVPAAQAEADPGAARAADRRRRWTARLVAWPSVAAVLLAAVLLPDDPPAAVRFSAADRATGVTASAALEDREWGTAVGLRVSGLPDATVCELLAVDRQGRELPLLTWHSDTDAERSDAPLIETAAPVHPSEIDHLTVRTPDGVRLAELRR